MVEINQHTQGVILPQLDDQVNRTSSAIQQCDDIKASIEDWLANPITISLLQKIFSGGHSQLNC